MACLWALLCADCFFTHLHAPNVLPSSFHRQLENVISSCWMNGLKSTWMSAQAMYVSVLEQSNCPLGHAKSAERSKVCCTEGGLCRNVLLVSLFFVGVHPMLLDTAVNGGSIFKESRNNIWSFLLSFWTARSYFSSGCTHDSSLSRQMRNALSFHLEI